MTKKRSWLAISVTTYEALMACIEEECLTICIEGPLYYEMRDQLSNSAAYQDYDFSFYDSKAFIILKKVRGIRRFDDAHFSIFYYTLDGM